jgi:isoquinoline 1-oxidoreductase beta subunit
MTMDTYATDPGRREFLKVSALAGGGLIIGLTLPGCGKREAAGSAVGGMPNAWLKIGGDNRITVLVDRSEMGQGVYTALPMLLAEELEVPLAAIAIEAAPSGPAYFNQLLGTQITGGSTSVREAWDKLRQAGAAARVMLIQAAAAEWKIDVSECRVEGGRVLNADGDALTYGEVAEAASKLPVPKDVPLKPAGEFKLIGTRAKRTDTPGKVDGSAQFGIDVQLPGMLYAALAQSPVLGGSLKSVDASVAEKMPGVRKVVTTGSGIVVVADHYWQARQARDALRLTWDAGPNAGLDSDDVFETLAKAAPGSGIPVRSDGDAAAALKSAAKKISAVYQLPLLAHATLEPMNCTADVRADGCDLYVGTQWQDMAQATAAKAAGLEPAQVNVHTTLLGGGFGRRIEMDFIPAAVEASKALGQPVKLIWTREDDMTHDAYRPPAHDIVAGGLDKEGRLVAWQLHLVSPSVTARVLPGFVADPKVADPLAIEAAQNYPYDVPNVSVSYLRQEIGINVGYWRSVSHALNCFVAESFMDEMAHAAGKDPFEFRRDLLGQKPRFKRVLEQAASQAGWGKAAAGRHQGIALMEGYGTHIAQVAEVSVNPNGAVQVHRVICAVDCGRMVNPAIVESQIESGIIFGLTAALWGEITLEGGRVRETNFDKYRLMRLNEVPVIEVMLLDSDESPGGIGEPSTAVVAPAVCNAIFAATGKRLRRLPIARTIKV